MKTITIPIKGMHCRSCELLIEEKLGQVQGVKKSRVSQKRGEAVVEHGADVPSRAELEAAVREAGYSIGKNGPTPWLTADGADWSNFLHAAVILIGLYFLARVSGLTDLAVTSESVGPAVALGVGLVAGVSTCMALVGGLVLAVSARHAELHPEAAGWQKFRPHLWFNLGRIVGFGLLGGLLGSMGSFLKLSPGALAAVTVLVGVVMVMMGVKLTGLSPRLAEGGLMLPAGLARLLGIHHSSEYSPRSAMTAGALTFFLPCGFTQAMQVVAVGTGSFTAGALTMSLFALGTAPALLGIGGLTSLVKGRAAKLFFMTAGVAVLAFGLVNVNNGLAAAGINLTKPRPDKAALATPVEQGTQVIKMTQKSNGYYPNSLTVRAGVPVRFVITSETEFSCASSFVIPSLGVGRNLRKGENIIEFTPTKAGVIPFSCSMGMYRGQINVVAGDSPSSSLDNGTPYAAAKNAPSSGSSCGAGGCGCGGGGTARVPSGPPAEAASVGGVQIIKAADDYGQLEPGVLIVKKGKPVELTVTPKTDPVGCMTAFYNEELGIDEIQEDYPSPTVVRFTPKQTGDFYLTCAMGMSRAVIRVI